MLAALVLTVLTLVGGAASATGAAPAPTSRSLAPAVTAAASVPAAPQTRHTGHRTGHDVRHRASGGVAEPGPGAVAQAGHEQPGAAADPAQAPRAGTGRAYLLLHAPPPPHDALTPALPGPAEPRGGVHHVAADSFDVPGSRRGALPGVRGPPGRNAGPTTGHPSCSADPAPRPH